MNIVFIGAPGSGKSTFGKFVADLMNIELIDTDRDISQKYGLSVSEIFEKYGQQFFRDLEEYEAVNASQKDNKVIATGGGIVENERAIKALKTSGLVVYLCLSGEELEKRLENDHSRPLLEGENKREKIENLLLKRGKMYLEYADIVLYPASVIKSRNIEDSPLEDRLGALYVELVMALEKRIYQQNHINK